MRWPVLALFLGGCLLGADARKYAGEVGDSCEETFQCQSGLVCNSSRACAVACIDDEDCPDGQVCNIEIDDSFDISFDGCIDEDLVEETT